MEYRFTRNDLDYPVARLNMEAEAFAHWLNIEMSHSSEIQLQKIALAVSELLQRQGWEHEFIGREFHLELTRETATISANSILEQRENEEEDELDRGFDVDGEYDQEFSEEYSEEELQGTVSGLVGSCGLEDFQGLLLAWIKYLQH